ncbi:hypothetical protein BJ508DRAFT_304729 [Ascobolus immersus RN42]|uniref:Uncharacterized protein n=1 Tax=Ascobolus immersus RN42 TaxID=1160509 RepID=A0A3N4IH67_ASCIM|nr:hypothetical protein BJ508DRAFT_304729 [Ascobolus immersus RN42]
MNLQTSSEPPDSDKTAQADDSASASGRDIDTRRIAVVDLATFEPPAYISPSTHKAIIAYLSTIPPQNRALVYYTGTDVLPPLDNAELLFELYLYICYHPVLTEGPTKFYMRKSLPYRYHPALEPVIEEMLLFYVRTLVPYFTLLGSPYALDQYCKHDADHDPRPSFLQLIMDLAGDWDAESAGQTLAQRHAAGLLRAEQVQIIAIALRMTMGQIAMLIDAEMLPCWNEADRLCEMKMVCRSFSHLFWRFLGHESFRSERLELLLLGYLREDEVNWDVVRGLKVADAERRRNPGVSRFRKKSELVRWVMYQGMGDKTTIFNQRRREKFGEWKIDEGS